MDGQLVANVVGVSLLVAGGVCGLSAAYQRLSQSLVAEEHLGCNCGCADLNEIDEADELEAEWLSRVDQDSQSEVNHG